jgi:hypothetical protein
MAGSDGSGEPAWWPTLLTMAVGRNNKKKKKVVGARLQTHLADSSVQSSPKVRSTQSRSRRVEEPKTMALCVRVSVPPRIWERTGRYRAQRREDRGQRTEDRGWCDKRAEVRAERRQRRILQKRRRG